MAHRRRLLVGSALLASVVTLPAAAPSQSAAPRVIDVVAERFEFWPSEIAIDQGETVELRIHSLDTLHGFRIVGTETNLVIPKRGSGYVVTRFTGGEAGRYTFECSRMCGAGHNFMRGSLVVRPAAEGQP